MLNHFLDLIFFKVLFIILLNNDPQLNANQINIWMDITVLLGTSCSVRQPVQTSHQILTSVTSLQAFYTGGTGLQICRTSPLLWVKLKWIDKPESQSTSPNPHTKSNPNCKRPNLELGCPYYAIQIASTTSAEVLIPTVWRKRAERELRKVLRECR